MDRKKVIIALVGRAVSGKDTLGKYLEENYGFTQVITGQLVRDYISAHGLGEPTRDLMIRVANEVRAEQGADYFVRRGLETGNGSLIFNGVRAVGEVTAIREAGGIIIAIDAPIEKRYEWATGRQRTSDQVSFEDFARQEKLESTNKSASAQSLDEIVAGADYTLRNEKSLADLYSSADILMAKLNVERV